VVESVLARLDRLDEPSRDAVEQLSVFSTPPARPLVEAVVPAGLGALVQAEEHGLLTVRPDRVSFRHELTRRAVLDALPSARRAVLNAHALEALELAGGSDPALLVHHAAEAGDAAAVVRLGPSAARSASASGAHRESAAHYRVVLGHRQAFDVRELAALLQASAIECYAVGDLGRSALADQSESVELFRTLGDPAQLGVSLRWLSRIAWWVGERPLAEQAGEEAVVVLDGCDDRQQLALAHSNLSQLAMLAGRCEQAVEHAELAIRLGREVDDEVVLAHALNNLGTALWGSGDARGRSYLEQSLDLALTTGQHENAARAYCNLVWQLCATHELDEAAMRVEEGIAHAEQTEHLVFWKYLHVEKAMINLALGRWDQALRLAALGLDSTSPIRSSALEVIATVRVRRGEEASALVEEAWQLATDLAELQRTAPAAGLVCEDAWLRDDPVTIRRVGGLVHAEATRLGSSDWVAPLSFWLGRAGVVADAGAADSPFALMARGAWAEAAAGWRSRGYPYETALAQVLSDDVAAKLEGLAVLDELGAEPVARRVRRDLRGRGVTGVPRGPRPETRQNLAGLTSRQAEVLALLADGLTNADIARRLVLSVRTVDHHVTAVLEKLGAGSRSEAVAAARRQGWAPLPGRSAQPG
jgi:DNA-binding CsgD family transcriptional regulator/tetratricopeptide (TPR) repeat protein